MRSRHSISRAANEGRAASASPPCVMRRPNGRCSLNGLVWPSPDSGLRICRFQTQCAFGSDSSYAKLSPPHLFGEDFFLQRLRPEIGRVPVRRTRDSKDALEKPAAVTLPCSGHFRRVSTCRQKNRTVSVKDRWRTAHLLLRRGGLRRKSGSTSGSCPCDFTSSASRWPAGSLRRLCGLRHPPCLEMIASLLLPARLSRETPFQAIEI